ncbi:unnamed protein product [Caenorhabditis nigoni]
MKLHLTPYVVQKMIVDELGLDERLNLSVTSKRTCKLLGKFKIGLHSFFISIDETEITVHFWKSPHANWIFLIPLSERQMKESCAWKMDGSTVQVEKEHSTMSCVLKDDQVGLHTTRSAVILFDKLIKHLKIFVDVPQCRLATFRTVPAGLIPNLRNIVFEKLDIQSTPMECVTLEELKMLLESVRTHLLLLDVEIPAIWDYKYMRNPETEKSIDRLEIGSHSWVDLDELPAARAVTFQSKMQLSQVNTIMKSWISGKNRDMEIGRFEIDRLTDQNREIVFAGVETHVTQVTETEIATFFNTSSALPDRGSIVNMVTVDVVRVDDGTRATVIGATNPRQSKQNLFVIVWTEKNLTQIGRVQH